MCMVPFLRRVSVLWKKKKQGEKKKTSGCSAYPFHAWTCGSSFVPGGTSHEHFNRDQEKWVEGGGGQKALISCQAAFQEMVNLWDHDASSPWTCFIMRWRTIQLILYKMFIFSFLTRLMCTSRLLLPYMCLSVNGGCWWSHTSIAIG